jgi:hypothetical protein
METWTLAMEYTFFGDKLVNHQSGSFLVDDTRNTDSKPVRVMD